MTPFNKVFEKVVEFSKNHIHDQAKFQNWCGSIAMALSCAAFTGSVAINKGIPSEQKEFLVSQELADGVVNVALFWVMTDRFKKWADNKVLTGHVFPEEMKSKVEQIRKLVGEKAIFADMKKHFTPDEIKKISSLHSGFKNGISLLGSLAAASIITPLIRNVVASKFQNRHDDDKKPAEKTVAPVLAAPVAPLAPVAAPVQRPFIPSKLPQKPQGFLGRPGMRI